MTTKEWRPEISSAATSVVIGLVVLGLFGWCYHWYETTNRKVEQLHAARQEDALKKESERQDALGALARDVQRHHEPTWAGLLDGHDMSPWITVPAGYGWTFDAKDDVKVHYRIRNRDEYGVETFQNNQPGKLIQVDADKIKIENVREGAQRVKLWVYQYADTTPRVKMPGGEVLTFGAPTTPHVERVEPATGPSNGASAMARPTAAAKQELPSGTSPLEESPQTGQPKVVANGPPGPHIDMTLDCGDRQLAIPEPHESPEYSSGLYGITVKVPPTCWSEWLVVPQGYTPYALDVLGYHDVNYEIYPAHNGNWTIAGGEQFGRTAFKSQERSAFQSIRFEGRMSTEKGNVVKLLFTKP